MLVKCCFSEKAVMACKAAIMGDERSYHRIRESPDCTAPSQIKQFGREVENWDEVLWSQMVCSVAYQAVYQKFSKSPCLQAALLCTGDKLMAEATRHDRHWGIGVDISNPRSQNPSRWNGTNILGWALMEVRNTLRSELP